MSQKKAKSPEDQFTEELERRQSEAQPDSPQESASLDESELTEVAVETSDESGTDVPVPSVSAVDGTAGEVGTAIAAPIPSAEAVAVVGDPTSAFRAMDRMDEVQIIEEIEGRMSDVLVYKIPGKGTDLSWSGVREAIRLLVEQTGRTIRIGDKAPVKSYVEINGEQYVEFMAYAFDEASGQGYWGLSNQPVRMKLKDETVREYKRKGKHVYDDGTVDDEFASTKALSKAQRNALKYFIPEQIRQGILAIAKNDPKTLREITMGVGAPAVDAPAALDDEEATALIEEVNELYRSICRAHPEFKKRLAPGAFSSKRQSAWSSHAALRSLRDDLIAARDGLEKK